MTKGTKLDYFPDDLPLNEKLYKYEDGQLYIKTPKEPVYYNLSDILTKKDVVKLIDILGTFIVAVTSRRGDIGIDSCDHYTAELKKLRDEMSK